MKILIRPLVVTITLGAWALIGTSAFAQSSVQSTTTTTTRGTVTDLSPTAIAVKVDTSPVPVRYTFTKTTTYVDESGNPVSIETVKTGLPVTVYYDQNGDKLTATKVVVKKTVSTTGTDVPVIQEQASPSVNGAPPSVNGVVRESDSDSISIRSDTTIGSSHYKAKDATAYIDENGNPVARDTVKAGMPVTIFYERDGDDLVATRVVVRNSVQPTTQIIEEKKTSTTTEQ